MSTTLSPNVLKKIEAVTTIPESNNLYNGHDALLILASAYDIFRRAKEVRAAAKRIKPRCTPTAKYVVELVLQSSNSVAVVKGCLGNLELQTLGQ